MKKMLITSLLLAVINLVAFSQSFEGFIVYKIEIQNPDTKKMDDKSWSAIQKKLFGEKGFGLQKYYYKNDKYTSYMAEGPQKGYQTYNPNDGLIYSWKENEETAMTSNSRKYIDEFEEIVHQDGTELIMGIRCKSIVVISKSGKMTMWYNSDYLKVDPALYKNHKYGHYDNILKEIKCLPLKVELKNFMMHMTQTATEFNAEPVDDKKFELPKFKEVVEDPLN